MQSGARLYITSHGGDIISSFAFKLSAVKSSRVLPLDYQPWSSLFEFCLFRFAFGAAELLLLNCCC